MEIANAKKLEEVSPRSPIDPLTIAYDGQVSEIFALGQDDYRGELFRFIRNRKNGDEVEDSEGREMFLGQGVDRADTRAKGKAAYDNLHRGIWRLEIDIEPKLYDPIAELCESLAEQRWQKYFTKGVKNG